MKYETFFKKLIAEGTIERVRVNRYLIHSTDRSRGLGITEVIMSSEQVRNAFGDEISHGNIEFKVIRLIYRVTLHRLDGTESIMSCTCPPGRVDSLFELPTLAPDRRWSITRSRDGVVVNPVYLTTDRQFYEIEYTELRRITRDGYHTGGNGIERRFVSEALRQIPLDADGVRRSYGVEWEINRLTEVQEDKLARLLDTMHTHTTERDGSLSSSGVEIVFAPMSRDKMIETWNRLQSFCREEHLDMMGTGAHVTYGVSNARVSGDDLKIRLNRLALAVKAVGTQPRIRALFGRNFTSYAHLPRIDSGQSYRQWDHSIAFSASRGTSAFECRLCSWQGNIERIIQFLKAMEPVFTRPFTKADFVNVFDVIGADDLDVE